MPLAAFELEPEDCYANSWDKTRLLDLKANNFATDAEVRSLLAGQLQHCLADTDPAIRDGVAYEAYFTWLRAGLLTDDTVTALLSDLTGEFGNKNNNPDGVYLPFVALVLSEVVRADRVKPVFSEEMRNQAVEAISEYLHAIEDYRGFDQAVGWRHAVAHSADVVLQLGLNKNINGDQLQKLAGAIALQVRPQNGHFYVYAEPERMARAIAYSMLREEVELAYWIEWLDKVSTAAPFEKWGMVFMDQQGLANRNNIRQFLTNLYAMISTSKNPRLQTIAEKTLTLINETG